MNEGDEGKVIHIEDGERSVFLRRLINLNDRVKRLIPVVRAWKSAEKIPIVGRLIKISLILIRLFLFFITLPIKYAPSRHMFSFLKRYEEEVDEVESKIRGEK